MKKGIFIGIPIISIFTFLFFYGAKSDAHMVFGIFLNLIMIFFLIHFVIGLSQKISRTIFEIELNGENIKVFTYNVLINKKKEYNLNINKINSKLKEFNVYDEHKIGWIIKSGKINLILFKSFFDEEVINQINPGN